MHLLCMCHYLADAAQSEDSRPPAVDDCEPDGVEALQAENRNLKSAIAAINSKIIYHLHCYFSAQSSVHSLSPCVVLTNALCCLYICDWLTDDRCN